MRTSRVIAPLLAVLGAAVFVSSVWPSETRAEMWCADPLRVDEWGVQAP